MDGQGRDWKQEDELGDCCTNPGDKGGGNMRGDKGNLGKMC